MENKKINQLYKYKKMKGILTFPSEKTIVRESGIEFLQNLKLTIDDYFKRNESAAEVKNALAKGEFVCAMLASNHDVIASFEIEAIVDDTVVLSFVDLAK